ncbi:MAG: DUF3179 domain-containing protein [Alphaproteobacteria bacterium]
MPRFSIRPKRFRLLIRPALLVALVLGLAAPAVAQDEADLESYFARNWPQTNLAKRSVSLSEVIPVLRADGIPSIDDPTFADAAGHDSLDDIEPVLSVEINGDARAYPLQIMTWHEIVNDVVGGVPVAVTYCPLCNTALIFRRDVDGQVLEFGTSGALRHSDLIMYDRQTFSWWQQFTGEAIVGDQTGTLLDIVPSRLESFARFRERHPDGQVLVPASGILRSYGRNPYPEYDSGSTPFRQFFGGPLPENIAPLAYVVKVEDQAWSLDLLRQSGRIEAGDLVITWTPGMASALDASRISSGRDLGNVVVQRQTAEGPRDVAYELTFAFAFHAFNPDSPIVTE